MFRQSLKNTMHTFCWCTTHSDRLFVNRTFPADFQQLIERTGRNTIMNSPEVCDGCASNLKQPLLHTLRATFRIDAAHSFHKYLRRQEIGRASCRERV